MIDLSAIAWPITYSWIVQAPWGLTRQSLTVNAPAVAGLEEPTIELGRVLWMATAAPAAVSDTQLVMQEVVVWHALANPIPRPVTMTRGARVGSSTPREHTPQLVMLTGHNDDDGRRRFFMAGAPADWVDGDQLSREGWEHLMPHASGVMLGLTEPGLASGLEWLIAYPGVLPPKVDNVTGTAFRRVVHLRVCSHTDKAPELAGLS